MSGEVRPKGRFPQQVYGRGTDPDPRFTLANERTFLAWIRTSLALMAAGIALEAFSLPMSDAVTRSASLVLNFLGVAAAGYSWFGWMRSERAMREGQSLPAPALAGPLGLGLMVVGIILGAGMAFG